MAVSQRNGRQQHQEQSASASAGTTPTQASGQGGGAGQAPPFGADFQQALEQQIAEAIQPVLDDFRQQMARGIAYQPPDQDAGGDSERTDEHADEHEGEPRNQQGDGHQAPGMADQPASQAEVPVKNVVTQAARGPAGALTGPLGQALQSVEHLGGQWLQSLLVAGVGGLLAEPAQAAVRQRAEQGLHTLLQKLFDAMPAGVTNQKMEGKTERTLQVILRDALDAVFAEQVRSAVQRGGQQTVARSLQGDLGGTLQQVREMFQMMASALIAVLRRHQQTILRLLLAFALLALESTLVQSESSKDAKESKESN